MMLLSRLRPLRTCRQFLALLAVAALPACVPLEQQTNVSGGAPGTTGSPDYVRQPLRYEDYVYDPTIRSVQCYVQTGAVNERLGPPIIPLSQDQPVVLEFDRIRTDPARLVVKLQHCGADWQPSPLVDQQFVYDYNEFYITEYYSSVNTKVPYYHYRFAVPKVKLTGNYVVTVFDPSGAPLVSRRVLVYENAIGIQLQQGIPPGADPRYTMQQIDFSLSYGAVAVVNPTVEVRVCLRQNFRWDNARYPLRPTFAREQEKKLEYNYFNFENAFPALNEYRFFDTRSLRTGGFNIISLDPTTNPRTAMLVVERPRARLPYEQYNDANGYFLTDNREYGNGDTDADYASTVFQLKADEPAPGRVYAVGRMTDYQLKPEFELTYNEAQHVYRDTALLKQGYYNYYYAVQTPGKPAPDYQYFEGSRYETENVYDLIVYYRAPGTRYDAILGYQSLTVNGRLPQTR